MATLEKIRKRSTLLLITIGLAMGAFILTDLLGSGDSLLRGNQLLVGKIDNRSIELPEFSQIIDERIEGYKSQSGDMALENVSRKQFADVVWEELIREAVLLRDLKKVGITVNDDELYNRIINNSEIRQAPVFKDELSGQFSEAKLQNYLLELRERRNDNVEARQFWNQWKTFEKSIADEALKNKYETAITLGLYKPEALAKFNFHLTNRSRSLDLVPILYSSIEDDKVTVTEADLKKYYKENKSDFAIDEGYRNFEFVSIEVAPSQEDRQAVIDELMKFTEPQIVFNQRTRENDTIPAFSDAVDDSVYVAMRSDLPMDMKYYREASGFNLEFDSIVFYGKVGDVFGPYEDKDGYIKLSKVSETAFLPDSVKARHILISFQGAERSEATRTFPEAKELADSILEVLQNDRSLFDSYSTENNDDPTAATNGGDLGWFTDRVMTPKFSNFCFTNRVGDLGLVQTEFGFHIIEITGQEGSTKGVRVASIARELIISEQTDNEIYNKISKIAESAGDPEKFQEMAQSLGAQIRTANNVHIFDENIIGLGRERDIVRWVFDKDRKVGDVMLHRSNENSYVAVHLTDKVDGDYEPFELVREDIEDKVFNQKKAAYIKELLQPLIESHGNDLNAIAQAMNATSSNVTVVFSQNNIDRAGQEPKVVGAIHGIPENTPSILVGDVGVYVALVASTTEAPDQGVYDDEKQAYIDNIRGKVPNGIITSKRENAKIKDNRHKFF
ncbi:MAG: SurA N-terminal domain-containing protein [Cryomorphaceae bacterium]|nr:SurA N-terminal domain-containing protein [Cryomorphaceae bacterium]